MIGRRRVEHVQITEREIRDITAAPHLDNHAIKVVNRFNAMNLHMIAGL
jgi:hypothetical protein